MPSLFTRIIAGAIPAELVVQDQHFVAFLDIAPAAPGHCLLVPRQEAQHLADLPPVVLAALGPALVRLIAVVKAGTGCAAVNVLVNDGPAAGQAVPHAHVHVIPRFAGDGRFAHPPGAPYPAGELARTGARLRAAATP